MTEETLEEDEKFTRKESGCPWCGEKLWQGPEMAFCNNCPKTAKYREDLSEAPPHIIRAFADVKEKELYGEDNKETAQDQ